MRQVIVLLSMLVLLVMFSVACSNTTTAPSFDDYDYPTSWDVNGETLSLNTHTAQMELAPPGWIPDGTLMTDDEILVYIAYHVVDDAFGWYDYSCWIYNQLHDQFVAINATYPPPFTYAQFLVYYMEAHGYDVPDEIDCVVPCD